MVLMPGHVETLRRQHSRSVSSGDAISSEEFAVGERGHLMYSPSLCFGIVEGLGLVLGQDCGRAARGSKEAYLDERPTYSQSILLPRKG